jgi:hypothetical protein
MVPGSARNWIAPRMRGNRQSNPEQQVKNKQTIKKTTIRNFFLNFLEDFHELRHETSVLDK